MKFKLKYLFLFLVLSFCFDECSIMMQQHDFRNPCSIDRNSIDCITWKKQFPKEHLKYEKRMEKYRKSGKLLPTN